MTTADTATIHASIESLQRLTDLLAQRRRQLAERAGLTEQQWSVLEEISTEHFIPSLFARKRESSAAAVSKILRQLLDKELVRVGVAEADGRQRQYELSGKGQRTIERLRAERKRAIDTIWRDLPERELSSFAATSAELASRIERYAQREEHNLRGARSKNDLPASR
jgi:DNA-binding MarR family transcriptional regulator